ncbi:MAG TPA: hypothetical protein VFT12_12890, partial [Thermoanaerobaculia bacterium]|nr:hypothetical protein [Thermoanaerobaculia bacterium]
AGDASFIETAIGGAKHLETIAIAHHGGVTWPHTERSPLVQHGFMMGGASVGHGLLRLYRVTRDRSYLSLAEAAGRALVASAEHPSPGMARWPVLVEPVHPMLAPDQAVKVSWWDGTAGIGMFLLELHEFSRGIDPPSRFSPSNP